MRVFVRVAECGSFSGAAHALNLANASVTTAVRHLEAHLQVTLIHRDTRRLQLTEEGHLYLGRARQVLKAVEDADAEVQPHWGELRGPLHVEMPISIGHALITPRLGEFARRHPQVLTTITLTNEPNPMIERAIDVAIRMDAREDALLVVRPIHESHYVVCCTPERAATLPADPRRFDPRLGLGLLPQERRQPSVWRLTRGDENCEIEPQGPLSFNSSDAVLQAALAGVGVAHVLDVFANRPIADGRLVAVYTDWQTTSRSFKAVTTRPRADAANVRAFIEFLREVLDDARQARARAQSTG